jgi:hypothetical protein
MPGRFSPPWQTCELTFAQHLICSLKVSVHDRLMQVNPLLIAYHLNPGPRRLSLFLWISTPSIQSPQLQQGISGAGFKLINAIWPIHGLCCRPISDIGAIVCFPKRNPGKVLPSPMLLQL